MLVAAALAGAGAVFFTKQNLDTANFQDAIKLIQNDDDAYWCKQANSPTFQNKNGDWYCGIHMPEYQRNEPAAEGAKE